MKLPIINANETTTKGDPRWKQVLARDATAEGKFFYSVKTTGVYCRPSCASRPARPENVQFHNTIAEAERAGFRPCKRCKPDQLTLAEQHSSRIERVCRLIEASEQPIRLEALANEAELSVYHFHRVFKAVTGLTPKAYFTAHRAKRVRSELHKNATVTQAIYEAGYNTNSRFYAESKKVLGMTPSKYRAGGKNMQICFATGQCALGVVLVASSVQGICAILLGDNPQKLVHNLLLTFPHAHLVSGDKTYEQQIAKVIAFVDMPAIGLNLPLDMRGTAFQQRVWQALQDIPAGKTASYTEIAKHIGSPKAVRAVASACAANTIAVAIPCHRVVRSNGGLSGYRWGVERKQALLDLEQKK